MSTTRSRSGYPATHSVLLAQAGRCLRSHTGFASLWPNLVIDLIVIPLEEDIFEDSGIWPVSIEADDSRFFLLWYHRSDGEDRLVSSADRVICLTTWGKLLGFVGNIPNTVGGEAYDSLSRLAGQLSSPWMKEESAVQYKLGSTKDWLGGVTDPAIFPIIGALDFINFLDDWHATVRELQPIPKWPRELNILANELSEIKLFGSDSADFMAKSHVEAIRVLGLEFRLLMNWIAC